MSLSRFQNPKIHSDLLQIFREFFGVHRNMGKYFRITIEINTMKNTGELGRTALFEKTSSLRAQIENIKAFTTLLW
ncbi:MAG: hypothetical protein EB120_14550, partial [Proteobacteria bacterium]|nr:hypothetical protein [Pseudomonadota bacterium]